MNILLFNPTEYQRLYSCNLYDVDQIPLSKRQRPWIGISFILLFFIFEIAYIPPLFIMRKKPFWNQPCYKLMFLMGISDVCCLVIIGLITGYYAIQGYVFCSSPTTIFLLGCAAEFFWVIVAHMGIILAINRCLEMYDPVWAVFLFDKWKLWPWACIPLAPASAIALWFKPIVFSSVYATWAVDPHIGYRISEEPYHSIIHIIHNAYIIVAYVSLYIIFFFLLWSKVHRSSTASNIQIWHSQKETYIQVFTICLINGLAPTMYVFMQYVPVPDYVFILVHYAWILLHGLPAIIYICLNKTIRKRVTAFVKHKKITIFASNSNLP